MSAAEASPAEEREAEVASPTPVEAPALGIAAVADGTAPSSAGSRAAIDTMPAALRALERQLAECVATLEQSHVQLSQSRPDSKLPSSVSQTTRNIMAKRALAQLDELSATLGGTRAELVRLREGASALRDEYAGLERERAAALHTAERVLAEGSALAQLSDASQAEASRRAEQSTRELSEKLHAASAEAKLLNQLNHKLLAESDAARAARDAAEARAASAEAAAHASADAAGGESGLRARDRALLARLAAENAVFVAQLKRARADVCALQERLASAEHGRERQLSAALAEQRDELQATLLADWGTSAQLERALAAERMRRERTELEAREEARLLGERVHGLEAELRDSEARRSDAERALAVALEEVGLVNAGIRKELHSAARADAQARSARERLAELETRDAAHAAKLAALREAEREAHNGREVAESRGVQLAEQLAGVLERERTGRRVAERLREEAAREHSRRARARRAHGSRTAGAHGEAARACSRSPPCAARLPTGRSSWRRRRRTCARNSALWSTSVLCCRRSSARCSCCRCARRSALSTRPSWTGRRR